jgi:hypothetical protein
MTTAPSELVKARALLIEHLDMHPGKVVNADLDPAEVGIVGDTRHVVSGDSYHLGRPQQRRSGYSVSESTRDSRGLSSFASALDIGWFDVTVKGKRWTLRDFSKWLVDLCAKGDPDCDDIREVIYSLDGKTVKRWDRLRKRSTGDSSHLTHTHLSEFRDARGRRMVRIVTRWLQHIGLVPVPHPQEDSMPTVAEVAVGVWGANTGSRAHPVRAVDRLNEIATVVKAIASKVDIGAAELTAIEQAARDGAQAALAASIDEWADASAAKVPPAQQDMVRAAAAEGLREVFADAGTAPPQG